MFTHNIAINPRTFGAGLKTASGFSPVMAGVMRKMNNEKIYN